VARMIEKKTVAIIVFFIMLVLYCGCIEDKDGVDSTPKTVNMTAQELSNDVSFSTAMSGGVLKWTTGYKSLNEGDTLIITDKISNISYTNFLYNATTVIFNVENHTIMGTNTSTVGFLFEGDITDDYHIGDDVKITLTVKHFVYTNETTKMSLDMEVFEEGWDQEYFITHFFAQIIPDTCITKV